MKTILKFFLLIVLLITGTSGIMGQISINGKVIDSEGNPVIGANIAVKGTNVGAITDVDGKFTLKVPSSESIISVSFIGYLTKEMEIGTRTSIDITLETDATSLG